MDGYDAVCVEPYAVTFQQVRIGVGQVLEYCQLARRAIAAGIRPVLLLEAESPDPWRDLTKDPERSLAILLDTQ